jgi:hypothetical protein
MTGDHLAHTLREAPLRGVKFARYADTLAQNR